MSPSKIKPNTAGIRPPPLKVQRDSSWVIQKQGSSPSSLSLPPTSPPHPDAPNVDNGNQQRRQPIIIYTNSPKIIHTKARDFMALVQKLTGLSHPDDAGGAPAALQTTSTHPPPGGEQTRSDAKAAAPRTTDSPSSQSADRIAGEVHAGAPLLPPAAPPPPVFDPSPPHPLLPEIPLFAPNGSDALSLFCSPLHYHGYGAAATFSPPNLGSSISPSTIMDAMKALHEY